MAKLSIPVIVYIDDVERLIQEIKGLQTYKLHEGDDRLLIERDEVARLLVEHIEAKVK